MSYLPPKRRLDETTGEYLERLEWHRQRVPVELLHKPIRGHTATAGGLRHWSRSDYIGRAGSGAEGHAENDAVFRSAVVDMPTWQPVVWRKRTPAERIEDILGRLTALAVQSYVDGTMHLPRSICAKLVALGVYRTIDDASAASVEDVTRAFTVYAQNLMDQATRRNGDAPAIVNARPQGVPAVPPQGVPAASPQGVPAATTQERLTA